MENKLREYAKLLIEIGLNVQQGQTLVISSPVDCAPFARLCASAAYDVGCREVVMRWTDDYMNRERFLRADDSVFDTFPAWQKEFFNGYADEGAAFLNIAARDPEALRGVAPDRLTRASRSETAIQSYVSAIMSNACPWCVASVPIPSWAKKVFPNDGDAAAMEKLWNAIFKTVRVTEGGDAVEAWRAHCAYLDEMAGKLNALQLKQVRYKNALGTDVVVGLPEEHVWLAGADTARSGVRFVANMPTEEVFSAPKRDAVDGVLAASKPLALNGNVIEGIRLTLEHGRIVETATVSLPLRLRSPAGQALQQAVLPPFPATLLNEAMPCSA